MGEGITDIPRFRRGATVEEVSEALRTAGCAVVERLMPEESVDRVMEDMAPWIEATPNGADPFSGLLTRRTGALVARSRASWDFVAHPLVLGVCEKVLWPKKSSFQLHLTQLISIGPESPGQPLHRDQWCFDSFPFPDDIDVEVSTIWAMHDFTAENGATRVIPGSHTESNESLAHEHRVQQAVMPKGSVVLYTGRTIPGGGENRSDAVRTGLNIDYVLGWLRQEENQYLSVPPDVARTLPVELQRIVGYAMGSYALGYVDDVRSPADYLAGSAGASSFGAGDVEFNRGALR
ncbi:MAG: phytanoyl-CoA dioxygenase family protein [Actinomycetota bacterium]